ncbi:MAG: VWA domain-containing protein [Bacteroidales bacterium]|nr:VWA domain-containing protein [Bacteroidales bacterium]
MVHFEHIEYLWLLLLVALAGVLWGVMSWRERKRLEEWGDRSMFGRLIPDRSPWRPAFKMALTLSGIALLIVALANPQFGTKIEKGKRSGSDIAICLDVSNSMMAEDIQPNRLERSKKVVTNLLSSLTGDRVSLVVYAGTSFIQMPLTNDYSATKLFLDQVSCDMIASQGTAIGDAIQKSMETFGYGDPDRKWEINKGRAIIVISDGENHEDDAVGAAREAAKQGIRVCTIGMGLPEGSPIPEYNPRGRTNNYKRDKNGSIIMTHLNEDMLRQIASAGNGTYLRASNAGSGLSDITSIIQGLEKEEMGEAVFSAYESRYIYPLAAALLCLLAEVILYERRNRKWKLFDEKNQ